MPIDATKPSEVPVHPLGQAWIVPTVFVMAGVLGVLFLILPRPVYLGAYPSVVDTESVPSDLRPVSWWIWETAKWGLWLPFATALSHWIHSLVMLGVAMVAVFLPAQRRRLVVIALGIVILTHLSESLTRAATVWTGVTTQGNAIWFWHWLIMGVPLLAGFRFTTYRWRSLLLGAIPLVLMVIYLACWDVHGLLNDLPNRPAEATVFQMLHLVNILSFFGVLLVCLPGRFTGWLAVGWIGVIELIYFAASLAPVVFYADGEVVFVRFVTYFLGLLLSVKWLLFGMVLGWAFPKPSPQDPL